MFPLGLEFPEKGLPSKGWDTGVIIFARCLEASCHIELSICLCLGTPEMFQEGVASRELNCHPAIDAGEDKSHGQFPLPCGSEEVGLCSMWASLEEKIRVSMKAGNCIQQLQKQSGPSVMDRGLR